MIKAMLLISLILPSVATFTQNQAACNPNEKGMAPQCFPGSHAVAECVCDGPSGPCHWVWHCEKN